MSSHLSFTAYPEVPIMISYRHRLILFIPILSFVLFCNSPTTTAPENTSDPYSVYENTPCSELAGSQYVPATLDTILCAGADTSGILYVIDKSSYYFRCFISKNDTLYRHAVMGSRVSAEEYCFIRIQNIGRIVFRKTNDIRNDAYLIYESEGDKCDSIFNAPLYQYPGQKSVAYLEEGWTALVTYLDSAVNCRKLSASTTTEPGSFVIKNFPPASHIEYIASQQNGQYILVTRAEHDWTGDVAIHYGTPGEMLLRSCVRILRASDGGSTWIDYLLDGKAATAVFRVVFEDTVFRPGPAYNIIDGDTLELERLPADTATMEMLGFGCWESAD